MNKIIWKTEKRNISDLKPSEYNPRQASEKDVQDLTASLERFNLAAPIVINKDNHIIGGHFRLKILKDKGIDEIDVRIPNRQLTEEEERELNLRLNKNLGQWDMDLLANFDEEVLKNVGFESEELDRIFQLTEERDFNKLDLICDECNKKFGLCESAKKFRKNHNRHFFCSKQCYLKYHSARSFVTQCVT